MMVGITKAAADCCYTLYASEGAVSADGSAGQGIKEVVGEDLENLPSLFSFDNESANGKVDTWVYLDFIISPLKWARL